MEYIIFLYETLRSNDRYIIEKIKNGYSKLFIRTHNDVHTYLHNTL